MEVRNFENSKQNMWSIKLTYHISTPSSSDTWDISKNSYLKHAYLKISHNLKRIVAFVTLICPGSFGDKYTGTGKDEAWQTQISCPIQDTAAFCIAYWCRTRMNKFKTKVSSTKERG